MIFLLKKKKKKKKRGKKREEKKEKAKALERETMSQSPIDFLLILTVIKNPLLQLMKSVVACLFRHQLSEILGTPPHAPLQPNPPPPPPLPSPMDNMHGNLRFYYVQQPCLDYVLFLGFFEVISFSLSDINSGLMVSIRGPLGWGTTAAFSTRVNTTLVFLSLLMLFLETRPRGRVGIGWGVGGWGRGLLFFITVKNKILIIVDMVLTWKILWFQRVSEHVLELGHYKIKESKVCITHFDCLEIKKKKHILYILSFSILMKVYLCCFFPPNDAL